MRFIYDEEPSAKQTTLATWRTRSPRLLYVCTQCLTSCASGKWELFVNPAICENEMKILWRSLNKRKTKKHEKKYLKRCSIVDYVMSSRGI